MQTPDKKCYFCEHKMAYIDYKNFKLLRRFINYFARIKPRYYSGVCLKHQKKLSQAIKRARHVSLLPFVH